MCREEDSCAGYISTDRAGMHTVLGCLGSWRPPSELFYLLMMTILRYLDLRALLNSRFGAAG